MFLNAFMTRAMLFKVRRWSALCMQQALRFLSQRSHVVQVIQVSKVSEEMQRLCKDFVKIAFCYSCSACHVLWSLTVYNVNEFFKTCSYSVIISYWYVWYVWYVCVANSPERMNSHASDGLWLGAMFDATARTSSMAIFWNVHKWQPKAGRQAGRHGY